MPLGKVAERNMRTEERQVRFPGVKPEFHATDMDKAPLNLKMNSNSLTARYAKLADNKRGLSTATSMLNQEVDRTMNAVIEIKNLK